MKTQVMRVSEVISSSLNTIRDHHAEGEPMTRDGVESIIALLETVLPDIRSMEEIAEAQQAAEIEAQGDNIVAFPVPAYRFRCPPISGGAA